MPAACGIRWLPKLFVKQTDNQSMLVAFTRMTHHYRLYGAEQDLEVARMKLGLDRTKQNAIQQGVRDIPMDR